MVFGYAPMLSSDIFSCFWLSVSECLVVPTPVCCFPLSVTVTRAAAQASLAYALYDVQCEIRYRIKDTTNEVNSQMPQILQG